MTPIAGRLQIELRDYDPTWAEKFAVHSRILREALLYTARSIEHCGSTAVPGLAAKLIVDIVVAVPNSGDESSYVGPLTDAGYVLRVREPHWNEHRMFGTADRDVQLHVYSVGCPEIARMIRFRDRLRSSERDRLRYEALKRELAARTWEDMDAYAAAKTEVIEGILSSAWL